MSVTLDVYPLHKKLPALQEVLVLATEKSTRYLRDKRISGDVKIDFALLSKSDDSPLSVDDSGPATWPEESYAWFTVNSMRGGIDAYHWSLSDDERAAYRDEILAADLPASRRNLVRECFEVGCKWHLRMSASQLYATGLVFGFLASAFASLTNGIIFSSDGGWKGRIFPATAEEFDRCYYRPETIGSNDSPWDGVDHYARNLAYELA